MFSHSGVIRRSFGGDFHFPKEIIITSFTENNVIYTYINVFFIRHLCYFVISIVIIVTR